MTQKDQTLRGHLLVVEVEVEILVLANYAKNK